jgi:hypothetical protein
MSLISNAYARNQPIVFGAIFQATAVFRIKFGILEVFLITDAFWLSLTRSRSRADGLFADYALTRKTASGFD